MNPQSNNPDVLDEKASRDITDASVVVQTEQPESRVGSTQSSGLSTLATQSSLTSSDVAPGLAPAANPDLEGADLERVLTHLSVSASPDGGYGWVNVLLVFLINAHTWGLNSSYSIFLSHYLSTDTFPGATRLQYAFIGGLSVGCCYLVSPLVVITTRKFGTSTSLIIGACFEAGSLIAASFTTRIWQLALSQGVAYGIGMGFLFSGSVGIVSQWFATQRSLANGLATAGSGIGGLIYSLATAAMIKSLGLAWALRILGILAFVVNAICGLLIRDRYSVIGIPRRRLDFALLRRKEFCLLLGFGWCCMLGYIVLLFSLASFARSIGLSASQAADIAAFMNLGQAVGRPLVGYFSDVTGRINMAASASFLGGLFALVIWTNAHTYGVLVFFALIMGTVAGTFYATISPLTAEVVGLKRVPSALNIVWLGLVLPCVFSEAIGLGTVQSEGGSYLGASLFTGFMYMGAAGCLLLLRGWKIADVERENWDMRNSDAVAEAAGSDEKKEGEMEKERQKFEGWRVLLCNTTRWWKV